MSSNHPSSASPLPPPPRRRPAAQRRSDPLLMGLLVAFVTAGLVTACLTFIVVRNWFSGREQLFMPPAFTPAPGQTTAQPFNLPDSTMRLQDAAGPAPKIWDGKGRVMVLLVGLDYRDWEEAAGGPARSDTMILLSMDPATRSAGMLSIPRDLWVDIPGYGYGKINTAYYLGEIYQIPGGGPGLAIQTVENLLGVTINYYARVDFSAFERFVDELGGVELNVPETLTVDPVGPGNTVTLEAGVQTLDGPTLLAYARNRDTIGGDFDRSQRQQQVIIAIRDQIINLDMLPQLLEKSPALYTELASGIHTNLNLQELLNIAWIAAQIPPENIQRGAIGVDYVEMSVSPDGLDILLPNTDAIRILRDEILYNQQAIAPLAPTLLAQTTTTPAGDPATLMQAENASIGIYNATYTPGLAARTSQYLQSLGLNILITDNASEAAPNTTIIDYTGNPHTVQYLIQTLNIQTIYYYTSSDPNSPVDIKILLGDDWAASNSIP